MRLVRTALRVALAALLAAVLTGACSGGGDSSRPGTDARNAALGVTFTTFDGRQMRLADLVGKPVVVNFFASWCTPCVVEMPEFETVHREFGDAVVFVGLNSQDSLAKGRDIANKTGVTYLLGTDPGDAILTAFDPIGLPLTVILRANGTVAEVHQGQLRADALRQKLRA